MPARFPPCSRAMKCAASRMHMRHIPAISASSPATPSSRWIAAARLPNEFSTEAHASTLAFEFSSGAQRIVVNCGAATHQKQLGDVLRATAAHSTITLADLSTAFLIQPGIARDLLGRASARRSAEDRHQPDANPARMVDHRKPRCLCSAVRFRRRTDVVAISARAGAIGARALHAGRKRQTRQPAIRDPLSHPSRYPRVAIAGRRHPAQARQWRGLAVPRQRPDHVEESIYLGTGQARKAEQLVVGGAVRDSRSPGRLAVRADRGDVTSLGGREEMLRHCHCSSNELQ